MCCTVAARLVTEWTGCGPQGDKKMATWLVEGASHNPAFNDAFSDDTLHFLLDDETPLLRRRRRRG